MLKASDEELLAHRKELVSTELSERLFRICAKLVNAGQALVMPNLVSSKLEVNNVPLCFAKTLLKLISLDTAVSLEVEKVGFITHYESLKVSMFLINFFFGFSYGVSCFDLLVLAMMR